MSNPASWASFSLMARNLVIISSFVVFSCKVFRWAYKRQCQAQTTEPGRNLRFYNRVSDVFKVPTKQKIHLVHRCNCNMQCVFSGFCGQDALGKQQLGNKGGLVCQTQKRYTGYRRHSVIGGFFVTSSAFTDNNFRYESRVFTAPVLPAARQ